MKVKFYVEILRYVIEFVVAASYFLVAASSLNSSLSFFLLTFEKNDLIHGNLQKGCTVVWQVERSKMHRQNKMNAKKNINPALAVAIFPYGVWF